MIVLVFNENGVIFRLDEKFIFDFATFILLKQWRRWMSEFEILSLV